MGVAEGVLWAAQHAVHELALFAAVGLVVGGLDDVLVDMIWMVRSVWRRATIYRRHRRMDVRELVPAQTGSIAIFVPAWRESQVIGPMIATALRRWAGEDVRLFVGCYANDPATIAAVERVAKIDSRLRLVVNARAGPTTKADNLNAMWRALLNDEAATKRRFAAVALHDAEDVVHPDEIAVYASLCHRFDLVQLPVFALIEKDRGMWRQLVSAVSADEFAESHGKNLVVREAVGAAVPSAGVGCALSRSLLERLADGHAGPFDDTTVTEDYEIGLRAAQMGCRGIFVRIASGGSLVAVHAHFPDTIGAAVRQKARWQAGIALSGWQRLGWAGNVAEHWMRFRDRRAILASLVLFCGYLASAGVLVLGVAGGSPVFSPAEMQLFGTCTALMIWRLIMRAVFVGRLYGPAEAIASLPRVLIGNFIAMAAARKALISYLKLARGAPLQWDKTEHSFPRQLPGE